MIFREKIEKIIERKIKENKFKFRNKGKDITYSLWWHIGRNIQDYDNFTFVCMKMAHYYDKHPRNFELCGITEIVVLNKTIFVYLQRPGIMIGKEGLCIDELERIINNTDETDLVKFNYEISIIEDRVSGEATIKNYIRLFK